MKVAIINYGMGNLGSVRRAFEEIGVDVAIANHPSVLFETDRIVLPGVGAFAEGMAHLTDGGWVAALQDVVVTQQKPLLGICLGMQMLASSGSEGGMTRGLDFIPGYVQRLDDVGCRLRIPHVGWNEVHHKVEDAILMDIPDGSDFYFVHSYAVVPKADKHLVATVSYGVDIATVIRNEHVFGCQFHPEKSSKAGRQFLRNFMNYSVC
ncbi:MAG TPA: imidazole glycerol phosphate synthase subunit HisH [Methylophilaceae bacterium]|jgi:glutamine amidotransferase|nr:imidazole glycerol phosphate synthase subunit HisH [Methylophilaceae bacterium]